MGTSVYPPVSPVPPEPTAEARERAALRQAKIAELDPLAAELIADLSGFAIDHREHAQAQRRLDAYLACKAADTAQSNADAARTNANSLSRATWFLVICTAVLAAATIVLTYVTAVTGSSASGVG